MPDQNDKPQDLTPEEAKRLEALAYDLSQKLRQFCYTEEEFQYALKVLREQAECGSRPDAELPRWIGKGQGDRHDPY
jgi:hypothetical protein